ncbi:MAG: putative glycoside hydrolase [Actinobacteria bacterium]|nr:putative glycoside hydrolase [Actinomycetota bacterium]
MKHKKNRPIISGSLIAFLAFVILIFPLDYLFAKSYIFIVPFVFEEQKITPGTQKAVYLTGYSSIGNKKKRQQIYELIDKTELNSIVFDVKDDNGYIDYNCTIPEVLKTGAVKSYYDIDEILDEFEKKDIYSIARFVAFKDNVLPRARTDFAILNKNTGNPISLEGSTWVDIYNEEAWDYYISTIKDLASRGVDEVQFDYVRAPSRGNIANAEYPYNINENDKVWAIKNFLKKVQEETKSYNIKISADVFGLVFITENDQGIGQLIEEMAPQLDYIYPMAYPSHYNIHFLGFQDAEAHPYEVVKFTLEKGLERIGDTGCKIIPFVQAFSYDLKYTDKEILAQIKAAEDLQIKGFLFWNAANKYSTVEKALISRISNDTVETN